MSSNGSNVSRLSDALWGIRCLLEPEGDAGDTEGAERESNDPEFDTFLSDNSELRDQVLTMLDDIEASGAFGDSPDPNLEEILVGVVDLVDDVVSTSHQMMSIIGRGWRSVGWTGRSFCEVGGRGTLGRVWELLKEVRGIVGVKRKLSEVDWESSHSNSQLTTSQRSQSWTTGELETSGIPELASESDASSQTSDLHVSGNSADVSAVRQQLMGLEVGNYSDDMVVFPGGPLGVPAWNDDYDMEVVDEFENEDEVEQEVDSGVETDSSRVRDRDIEE